MAERMKINEDVTVSPQPLANDIAGLTSEGFKTVVNFRTDGEKDQPLSAEEEGRMVREAGMEYLHIPVSSQAMKPEQVDEFREKFAALPKPMLAHCQGGKRAGAFVMMHLAIEQGMTGEQTLQQAEKMGFECKQPELKQFVESYVDAHRG